VPPKKKEVTLKQLAQELGLGIDLVRNVLKELPGSVSREVQDKIYKTARKLGYDFRKLKIGKRMQYRKGMLDEVLEKIGETYANWSRSEILKYLKRKSHALVDRALQTRVPRRDSAPKRSNVVSPFP
jgi:DNA-binding LacI/PurR family transcriptional regulator